MKKKKAKKQKTKKVAKKKTAQTKRHEIVVRVNAQPMTPSTSDLAEPIRGDGKSLSIPKTWLSEKQITRMVERTPSKFVYQRPAKGGGKWDYVSVSYVQRVLDYCFGFNWDFQIVEHGKEQDHVWVRGKLIVKSPDGLRTITKEQFGRSEVKYKRDSKDMLDYGNDLKAASSDALKKCASMLGIARDIYGKTDYAQESGRKPIEEHAQPQLRAPESPDSNVAVAVHQCLGIKGGGCPYGNEEIDEATYNYSKKVFKKPLCRQCQNDAK